MCKQPCQTLASSSIVGGMKLKILPAAFLFGFMSWPSGHCSQPEPQEVLTDGDWFYVVENDGATITASTATGAVTIPSRLGGYAVKTVGYGLSSIFPSSNSSVTSVAIPNSVTSIGRYAFYCRTGLTSVNIPDSVTIIGAAAFAGTGLTSVNIPDSVTSIGSSVFSGCSGLTSVSIPDSVTIIGVAAFADCTRLTSVIIPDNVTIIGSGAFARCPKLTSVIIPNGVTSIWDRAFGYCSGLTNVSIPDSVTSIGDGAFFGCPNLKEVKIPLRFLSVLAQIFDPEVASRLMIQLPEEANPPWWKRILRIFQP